MSFIFQNHSEMSNIFITLRKSLLSHFDSIFIWFEYYRSQLLEFPSFVFLSVSVWSMNLDDMCCAGMLSPVHCQEHVSALAV